MGAILALLAVQAALAAVVEIPLPALPAAVPIAPVEVPLDERLTSERMSESMLGQWQERLSASRTETAAESARILSARSDGVRERKVICSKDTKTITEYSGVPSRVKPLEAADRVFRHWIRTEEALHAILRTGLLRPGPVPYVEFTGTSRAYIKDIYSDVRGVFFTTPDQSSSEPRVMNEAVPHYVDFRLPEGVAALDLDMGVVLAAPAKGDVPIEIEGSSLKRP